MKKEAKKDIKGGSKPSLIWKIFFSRMSLPLIVVLVLMALSSLITVNVARKNPDIFGLVKGPSILQKEEDELVAKVGSLIALPENEDPVVATVSDKEQLQGQAFFENAIDGDKVLIYADAGKVVLYRPSEKRVVEVGTVNIQNQEAPVDAQEQVEGEESTPEPSAEASPEVEVEESEE